MDVTTIETFQGKKLEDAASMIPQLSSAEIFKGHDENAREAQPDTQLLPGLLKPTHQKPAKSKPRTCQHASGCPKLAQGRTLFCANHGGGRRCEMAGCPKLAQGSTSFCASHGGGRRCQHEDCIKSAAGATQFCKAHGGGKRCQHPGCVKSSQGSTPLCMAHGGGRRCKSEGCFRIAISTTSFCRAHGGQRVCRAEGCGVPINGNRALCVKHGGVPGYRRRPGREESGIDDAHARHAFSPRPARLPPDRQRAPQVLKVPAPPLRKPERGPDIGAWVHPQDRVAKPVRNVVILPAHNNPSEPHRAHPLSAPDAGALQGRHHLVRTPSFSENEQETTTALLSLRQLAVYKKEGEGGGAAGKEVDTTLCLGGASTPRAATPPPTVRPRTPRYFGRIPAHRSSNGRMAYPGVEEPGLQGDRGCAPSTIPSLERDDMQDNGYEHEDQAQEPEYEVPVVQFDDCDWPDLAGLTPVATMAVPSSELADFLVRMGALSETTRHDPITWRRLHTSLEEYIANHGLFEAQTNMVRCDEELSALFRGAPKVAAHHVAVLLADSHWRPVVLDPGLASARHPKRACSPSAHPQDYRESLPTPDATALRQAAALTVPHPGSQGAMSRPCRTLPQAAAVSSQAYPAPASRRDQEMGLRGNPAPAHAPSCPLPEEPRRSTWGDLAAAAKQLPHPRRAPGEGPYSVPDRARVSATAHQAAPAYPQSSYTGGIAGAGVDAARSNPARPIPAASNGWIRRPPSMGPKTWFSRPQDPMHHMLRQGPNKAAQLQLVPSQKKGSELTSSQSKTSRECIPAISAQERALLERTQQMRSSLLQRGVKRSRVVRPSYSG